MSHRLPVLAASLLIAAAAPAAAQAAPYSPLDKFLLQGSIQGDRFEIAGGKLAESKGATPAVRALGARLRKDHAKSLAEAARLARRLGITVPKTPSPTQEWELAVVGSLSGSAFDTAYATLEVQDHKQDIDESKTEVAHGANAAVRALAKSDLPTLRRHLALSKAAVPKG